MKTETTCDEVVSGTTLFSEALARTVIDSLSAHISILDENGRILAVNQAWYRYAVNGGMSPDYDFVGVDYLAICDSTVGEETEDALKVAAGIRGVIRGETDIFLYDYPCHSHDGQHWYYMRVIRMEAEQPTRVVVSHEEITSLKLTEEALRESRAEIEERKRSLEEANIALKVLLKQRESDREELEKKVLNNIKDLVLPYVEKLANSPLKSREKTLVQIVETHLQDIISPLLQRLSNLQIFLTPQEMQVAALVRDGKTSKEIAEVLHISETTVHFHRKNLRDKFGLKNRRTNLRAYLLSISE